MQYMVIIFFFSLDSVLSSIRILVAYDEVIFGAVFAPLYMVRTVSTLLMFVLILVFIMAH